MSSSLWPHGLQDARFPFLHYLLRLCSLEKTLMLGKIKGKRRRGQQKMRWLDSIKMSLNQSESWSKCWHGPPRLYRINASPGVFSYTYSSLILSKCVSAYNFSWECVLPKSLKYIAFPLSSQDSRYWDLEYLWREFYSSFISNDF